MSSVRRLGLLTAGVACLAVVVSACGAGGSSQKSSAPKSTSTTKAAASTSAASSSPAASSSAAGAPVHIKLLNSDGATVGVGMPIVAYFSAKITDGDAFAKATTVKVNGAVIQGGWYFEDSASIAGYPLEAHFRPAQAAGAATPFWPADSSVSMDMATQGVTAGAGLVFDDSLTLSMSIADAHISYVDCAAERMTVTVNGVPMGTPYLTSCGAPNTPTASGIKVVQQLGEDTPGTDTLRPNGAVRMVGGGGALGNYDLIVPWSVRITNGGEYVHAAAWNGKNIGARSTSDGCTNLNTPDAEAFYKFSRIGDVVIYTNTGGPADKPYDGYGDWNLDPSDFDNDPSRAA